MSEEVKTDAAAAEAPAAEDLKAQKRSLEVRIINLLPFISSFAKRGFGKKIWSCHTSIINSNGH